MLAARKTIQTDYYAEAAQPVGKTGKKARAKANPWGRYFLVVFVAVVVAISITGRYAEMARASYEIAKLKYAVAALEKDYEAKQIAVASLKAPGRIQEIAVSRLGMQLPDKVYYAAGRQPGQQNQAGTEMNRTATAPWGGPKVEAHNNRR